MGRVNSNFGIVYAHQRSLFILNNEDDILAVKTWTGNIYLFIYLFTYLFIHVVFYDSICGRMSRKAIGNPRSVAG